MYDVRCTMYDLQIVRSEAAEIAKQMRTRIRKAAIGRSYKAAEAPGGAWWQAWAAYVRRRQEGSAHVRFTI